MNFERYNYEDKKSRHLEIKKELVSKVGPGAYINPKVHSEFRQQGKPEYHQFFGSTEERFKGGLGGGSTGSIPSLEQSKGGEAVILPGPGAYDPIKDVQSNPLALRNVATAAF